MRKLGSIVFVLAFLLGTFAFTKNVSAQILKEKAIAIAEEFGRQTAKAYAPNPVDGEVYNIGATEIPNLMKKSVQIVTGLASHKAVEDSLEILVRSGEITEAEQYQEEERITPLADGVKKEFESGSLWADLVRMKASKWLILSVIDAEELCSAFIRGFSEFATPERWQALHQEVEYYSVIHGMVFNAGKTPKQLFRAIDRIDVFDWYGGEPDSGEILNEFKAQLEKLGISTEDVLMSPTTPLVQLVLAFRRYSNYSAELKFALTEVKNLIPREYRSQKVTTLSVDNSNGLEGNLLSVKEETSDVFGLKLFSSYQTRDFSYEKIGKYAVKITLNTGRQFIVSGGCWYHTDAREKNLSLVFSTRNFGNYDVTISGEDGWFLGYKYVVQIKSLSSEE